MSFDCLQHYTETWVVSTCTVHRTCCSSASSPATIASNLLFFFRLSQVVIKYLYIAFFLINNLFRKIKSYSDDYRFPTGHLSFRLECPRPIFNGGNKHLNYQYLHRRRRDSITRSDSDQRRSWESQANEPILPKSNLIRRTSLANSI